MSTDRNRSAPRVVAADEGRSLLQGFVVNKLLGEDTGNAFSLVEHTLRPAQLAAPIHTHTNEDEASFVLEGEIGAQIGDQVLRAGAGTLLVKPRGIPHTFWNAGTSPARLLELIWPAGFERYFEELDQLLLASQGQPDPGEIVQLATKYGMEMDFESIPHLMQTHGVRLHG